MQTVQNCLNHTKDDLSVRSKFCHLHQKIKSIGLENIPNHKVWEIQYNTYIRQSEPQCKSEEGYLGGYDMSRLKVVSSDRVNTTTEKLMKEFTQRIVANPPGVCPVDIVGILKDMSRTDLW